MEAPLPVSRVMLVCPHCDKPTRVGLKPREEHRQTLRERKPSSYMIVLQTVRSRSFNARPNTRFQ